MPYVETLGVQIHYEVEGNGPTIVCEHGFTSSLESFYEAGYVDNLKDSYKLILIDARGHGKSSKPHEIAAYLSDKRVADVLAVMDAEGVSKGFYFGYSMGGTTGFAIAQQHPERLLGVIIGGMHARSRILDRETIEARSRGFRLLGMAGLLEIRERETGRMATGRRERYLALDAEALSAASEALGAWEGVVGKLPSMKTRTLIFAGEEDVEFVQGAREAASAMPNAQFIALPGQDHTGAFENGDLVLPHIRNFLSTVN